MGIFLFINQQIVCAILIRPIKQYFVGIYAHKTNKKYRVHIKAY